MQSVRAPALSASIDRQSTRRVWLAPLALLVVAVLLGGGHLHGPIRNGLVQASALALLLAILAQRDSAPLPDTARGPLALLVALLALVLGQMVPLPWPAGLPGRETIDIVMALPGIDPGWRPLSLDPVATARFAASLLVPAAIALATMRADQVGRIRLLRALMLLATASAALGMLQLALGYPAWASPYGLPDPGYANGLFVNRNHQAMFLLCGLLVTGLLIRLEGGGPPFGIRIARWRLHAAWILVPFLALMTVAAGSRAGIGLLMLVLPATVALAWSRGQSRTMSAVPNWIILVIVSLVVAVIVWLAAPGETVGLVRARIAGTPDGRMDFLPDTLALVGAYAPWGSGLGTFVPVYAGFEDLDRVGPAYLNHAHNEYVEWLIEGGIAAALIMAGALILFAARLFAVLRSGRSGARKAMAVTGAAILLLLGAHNAVDYPLRTDALAAVAGFAIGLLFAPALDAAPPAAELRSQRGARGVTIALVVIGLLLGAQIVRLRLLEAAVGSADGGLAAALHSQDGMANAYVAEARLATGDAPQARADALEAIEQSPLSIVAVRTLAMANERLGDRSGARAAWRAAAGMGWRDIPTQYWAMRQALADGEVAIAGQRADAVLRMNDGTGPFAELMRRAVADARLRQGLMPRLALDPAWRRHFFEPPTSIGDAEIKGMLPTLLAMQRTAAPPTRREAWTTMWTLLGKERWTDALALERPFAARRRPDPGSLFDDGDFNRSAEDYRTGSTPFDWRVGLGNADNLADLDEAPPRAMAVSTTGASVAQAVGRWSALRPGSYVLRYRMSGSPESPSALGVVIRCGTRQIARSPTDNLPGDGFESRETRFTVPGDCPVAFIGVGGLASGVEAEALFDEFRLAPTTVAAPAPARG